MNPAFVERCFEFEGEELIARFQQPQLQVAGEYLCESMILWPQGVQNLEARGQDGVQALMLAMKLVHHTLLQTDAYKEGRLTLWTQRDLDLPPDWGAGPLYGDPKLWA